MPFNAAGRQVKSQIQWLLSLALTTVQRTNKTGRILIKECGRFELSNLRAN